MSECIIGILIAMLLLWLGEMLPNQTKCAYVGKGYSWKKVLFYSNIAAILGGTISGVINSIYIIPKYLNPQFLPFATAITAYITMQSMMTDIKILLINRNILRVAYSSMYILSIYNVFTNDLFKSNKIGLIIFTVTLILLFFYSSIGASDIRAIAITMPYAISIGGYIAVKMLIISLLLATILVITIRKKQINNELEIYKDKYKDRYKKEGETFINSSRRKIRREFNKSEAHGIPVGPFMIVPFLIFLLLYPILY